MNRNLVVKKSRVARLVACALLSLALISGVIPGPFSGALYAHAADHNLGAAVQVGEFSLEGTVGVPLDTHYYGSRAPMEVLRILLDDYYYTFNNSQSDPYNWVQNLPAGITALAEYDDYSSYVIYFYGTPTEASTADIAIVIPGADIIANTYDGAIEGDNYIVPLYPTAVKFNIKAPVVGNTILFGTYPQTRFMVAPVGAPTSPTNGQTYEQGGAKYEYVDSSDDQYDGWYRYDPIEWRVASKSNDKLFLIAEKAIDGKPVLQNSPANYQYKVWQQSTIRSWLNGYGGSENVNNINYSASGTNFITKSFNTAEASAITPTLLTAISTRNEDFSPQNHPHALVDTTDKIFLLSIKEAKNTAYSFSTDSMENDLLRQAVPTDYAKAVGVSYSSEMNTASWWLRSDGENFYTHGAYVFPPGRVMSGGTTMSSKNGVRPVLNLDLSKVIFTVESDGVFNAIPNSEYVIIDFDDVQGANFVHQIIREKNKPIGILPDEISRDDGNFSFEGWYTSDTGGEKVTGSSSLAANTPLFARWRPGNNIITWDPMDGEVSPTTSEVASNAPFSSAMTALPTPTRPGYTFGDWYNGFTRWKLEYSVVRDTTLYAYWKPDQYEATFDANGGKIGADTVVMIYQNHDAKLRLPINPIRTGHTFLGWFTAASGGSQITAATIVSGGANYYAHWTPTQTETATLPPDIPAVNIPTEPGSTADLPGTIDFGGGYKSDVTWKVGGTDTAGVAAIKKKYGYDIGKATDTKIDPATGLLITGNKEGYITLTATSNADATKTITITVLIAKNVAAIESPMKTIYLQKGKAFTPPVDFDGKHASGKAWGYKGYGAAPKLTWTSNKTSVATVNPATGKITAKKTGTAKITATSLNGKAKITFTVKVVKKELKLKQVAFTKPPESLAVGKTKILKLKLTSAEATGVNITFKSSKPSVISVDKAGKLYALKKGTAKITVKAGDKSKVITIKVK